jgi:hypothetical protein
MFEAKINEHEIKLVHKVEGHEYTFPIGRDTARGKILSPGVMAQCADAETSANDFAEEALRVAEVLVSTGRETRAIVLWYVDKTNNNLIQVKSLLERGWIVESVSALSPGEELQHVAQSQANSFWKRWWGHERGNDAPRYSRALIVMREPRDYEEAMRVNGGAKAYLRSHSAFELSFSDAGRTNVEELNSHLNDGWAVVFGMPLSGSSYLRETGRYSTSRALVVLKREPGAGSSRWSESLIFNFPY